MPDRWITFDCYGTLVDWQTGFHSVLAAVAGDRAAELLAGYHLEEPIVQAEDPTASYATVLTETLVRAAARSGIALRPEDHDVLVRRWADLPLFADTATALDELRADGWRLAVLTNCDDDLFASTWDRYPVLADLVITAADAGGYKPALGHFTAFERRTGVDRANWVHAAVSWWHDMRPAAELGLDRIWVDRERTGHDPRLATARIDDMATLPHTLRSLRPRHRGEVEPQQPADGRGI